MPQVRIEEMRRRLNDCIEAGKDGLRLDDPYKFDQLVATAEEVWAELQRSSEADLASLEGRFRATVATLTGIVMTSPGHPLYMAYKDRWKSD